VHYAHKKLLNEQHKLKNHHTSYQKKKKKRWETITHHYFPELNVKFTKEKLAL
jgi:hypothetical protein